MKKVALFLMFICCSCFLVADEFTLEKPTSDDILSILGYSYIKFNVPNEKKLSNIQCEIRSYAKDKNGVWVKQTVGNKVFHIEQSFSETPEYFTVGFFQKNNEVALKLEARSKSKTIASQSFPIKAEGKHGIEKMTAIATNGLSLDENGDIIIKWLDAILPADSKAKGKEAMSTYLALHVSLADGLKK